MWNKHHCTSHLLPWVKKLFSLHAEFFLLSRDVWNSVQKNPYWWRSSTEIRVVSDTLIGCCSVLKFSRVKQPTWDTTRISVELRHQYGIFQVESQWSLPRGKNLAREKRRLFSGYISPRNHFERICSVQTKYSPHKHLSENVMTSTSFVMSRFPSEVWENEKCCGNTRLSCFHSNCEFFQTFTSVAITLWKHRGNVFYCFYELKARRNFLCFHRVMVNGFEPIRARVVSCLFHKRS